VKPKLAFFRWTRPGLPRFIQRHLDEQVACLRHHFDVVLVDTDCDYAEVCETHRPDLALFESGVYAGPRRITNTSAFPDIPKVGFCNADTYCVTRSVFLSDMERWGVETYFTLSVSMAEYTPEIADRLFVWPNFVDPAVHRDYGQDKIVPVLFTGSQAAHYPWRSRVHSLVTQHFPSLTTPHGGWFDQNTAGRMVHGERYARLINSASVAPACGAIGREVIRKHFEIPAARSCLITERTPSIEAAGFVDMENAVFAEPSDVVDKLDHLFANPDELRRITDAGFELAHARHTMAQRDQILQWFRLHQAAAPGQTIVQDGPFEPLRLTSAPGAANSHPISGGLDRGLLRKAERRLEAGRLDSAEELLLRCMNYHFMPEPVLALTRLHLYRGDAEAAIGWVSQTIDRALTHHYAADPDPVEWAFLVRALLCRGKTEEAARRAAEYPHLNHLELERIRRVVLPQARPADGPHRPSVHVLPERDDAAWLEDLDTMLGACGRARPARRPALPLRPVKDRLRRRWHAVSAKAPQAVVRDFIRQEDISEALLVGASATARSTRAVLAGLRANANAPGIYWVHDATPAWLPGRGRRPGERLSDVAATGRDRFDVVVLGSHSPLNGEARELLEGARFVVLTGINSRGVQPLHAGLVEDESYALVAHHATHDGGYSVFRRL
jgi:Glycosyl transferases group 1